MSTPDCTPCVPATSGSECLPLLIEAGKYVNVSDAYGIRRVLEGRRDALLHHGSGKNPVKWADGSDAFPIRLSNLSQLRGIGFTGPIVSDSSGRIFISSPDPALGRQELIYDGGSMSWRPAGENRHCFPNEKILESQPVKPALAAFQACGPNGQTCLYRLPQNWLESQLPKPAEFDIMELASNICQNALREDDVADGDIPKILKLSVICDTSDTKGFPNFFIGEAGDEKVGAGVGLVSTLNPSLTASYGTCASWSIYEGGSLGIISAAGGAVTADQDGQYHFLFECRTQPLGGGSSILVKPFFNGSELYGVDSGGFVAVSSAAPEISCTAIKTMVKGDSMEFRAKVQGAGAVSNGKLHVVKLG